MTKAAPAPKVSYITEPYAPASTTEQRPKSQTIDDSYADAGPDAYKGLVAGNTPKSESIAQGAIGDMMDAMSNIQTKELTYSQKIQNILSGYANIADTKEAMGVDIKGDIPLVPNFRKEIVDGHALADMPMRPVVQRYEGLMKVLDKMIGAAKAALSPKNAASMTAAEIRSLHSYQKKLEETMRYCGQQLRDAKDCLNSKIDDGSEFDWIDSSS